MNSIILAVIGIIVLCVAILLVKKISGSKQQGPPTEQPVPAEEKQPLDQTVTEAQPEEPEGSAAPAEEEKQPEQPELVTALEEDVLESAAAAEVPEPLISAKDVPAADTAETEVEHLQEAEPAAEESAGTPPTAVEEPLVEQPAEAIIQEDAGEEAELPVAEVEEAPSLEPSPAAETIVEETETDEPVATSVVEEEAPAVHLKDAAPIAAEEPTVEEPIEAIIPEDAGEEAEPPVAEVEEEAPPLEAAPAALADHEVDKDEVAAQVAVEGIKLTLAQYAERLNEQEQQQREALQQAIADQQDRQRDRLQRELVVMNEKIALLDASYEEEIACYQATLQALEEVEGECAPEALAKARKELQAGNPEPAETLLADLGQRPGPAQGSGAYYSGRLAEGRFDLSLALQRYQKALENDPTNADYLKAAGMAARRLFKYDQAVQWLEQYVAACSGNEQISPVELAEAKRELAYTYVTSGRHSKAGPLYKEAMTSFAKHLGQNSEEMAISWFQIGELQESLGEYEKAVGLYKKALAILEACLGPDHPGLMDVLDKLAALCMELEMEKEAVPLYERLVAIRQQHLRPDHPQLAISLNNLAESYRLQRLYAEAEACYLQSLDIAEQTQGKNHPSVGAILQELAKLCSSQRKGEEAEAYQARATAIFEQAVAAEEQRSKNTSLSLDL